MLGRLLMTFAAELRGALAGEGGGFSESGLDTVFAMAIRAIGLGGQDQGLGRKVGVEAVGLGKGLMATQTVDPGRGRGVGERPGVDPLVAVDTVERGVHGVTDLGVADGWGGFVAGGGRWRAG